MADALPDNLIEINDPELSSEQIMALIRERLRQRRDALDLAQFNFPTFEGSASIPYPGEPRGESYDANLYYHLRLANEIYAQMHTEPELPPSPATRLPLIGPVWARIRPAMHLLILIYTNRAAAQQVRVNRHLVSVLNQLTRTVQEQQRALRALQAEVERLRGPDQA